jgi:hypothetical protein
MEQKTLIKTCVDCKQEFEINSGDLVLYEKVGLEIPEQCFSCRLKHHLAFSIFGKFRKGNSDLSKESLITVLPQNPRYPIYTSHEWWGDNWDPMVYGQDYDSSRSFFEQLKELQEKVPRPHQTGINNVNCDWCEDIWNSRNCYLSRAVDKAENSGYLYRVVGAQDSFDIAISFNMQDSYDCVTCYDSFNLNFSENSRDCIESYFLFDCRNCQNCFMSWNLRNKQYCIRNKQYTKETYEEELKKMKLDSHKNIENLKNEFENILKNQAVHRENFNLRTTHSTGNYLTDCDKCINCFTWDDSQNCHNSLRGLYSKDCIDQAVTWHTELSGNNSAVNGGYQIKYSARSVGKYSEYIEMCEDVEYCFGCVGLRKKKYCILNKQYTKDEYEKLKAQIITDMRRLNEYGNFFPLYFAPCDYNFSNSLVYFPEVIKDEIIKKGGYWQDEDLSSTDGVPSSTLPDSIKDTDSNISSQALICPETGYRFNISTEEYKFHKRKGFALPRIHFDLRMLKKARKTAVLKSYPYKCFYCQKKIEAYYPPEWNYQKIACEECYKQNIA